ncbi:MAG: hypothetical protein JXM73_03485 [Anaerolineae bacterium]|nr:hypothetical protein [Anaerolineae bacterium]
MSKKHLVYALCACTLLGLLAACVQADHSTPDVAERHPFSLDIAGEDGAEVSWTGYTDGYRPGTTETMRLAIRNNTDQPWNGRLCVQLLEPQPSSVVIPLAEQEFDLESGGGRERDVRVDLPANLPSGIYGLALVVHKPAGPVVDVIPVQVGGGEREPFQGEWPMEAALEACPALQGSSPSGRISVQGVEVTAAQVIVRGKSTLPDGTRVSVELWADGVEQGWWPADACASVEDGRWSLTVLLEPGQALGPGVQYMLRAYQPGGPNIVATFPFDLDGPPPTPTRS